MNKIFMVLILVVGLWQIAEGGTLSSYPLTGVIGGINWEFPVVNPGVQNYNVNWATLQNLSTSNINWNLLQILQQNQTGINWQALNTSGGGGINWINLGGQAVQGQIMCWNMTNGRPGKCAAISGITCTTCN